MRFINPKTGQTYVEKRRQRFDEPGQPREFTFSCYRQYPFLASERAREWFREALDSKNLPGLEVALGIWDANRSTLGRATQPPV